MVYIYKKIIHHKNIPIMNVIKQNLILSRNEKKVFRYVMLSLVIFCCYAFISQFLLGNPFFLIDKIVLVSWVALFVVFMNKLKRRYFEGFHKV